jgi:RNA polymerase sigma-70 factor, ECF subfamily
MTGDFGQAEDLAQETFVKAFRNLAAFDTTRRLSSWLFRIAHNTALDALRRPRPTLVSIDAAHGRAGERSHEPSATPAPDPVERRALGDALEAALAELGRDQRVAVSLRYEEGLSFDQIGQVLGIPEVTARSHVHRARKELSRRLTAAGWDPR